MEKTSEQKIIESQKQRILDLERENDAYRKKEFIEPMDRIKKVAAQMETLTKGIPIERLKAMGLQMQMSIKETGFIQVDGEKCKVDITEGGLMLITFGNLITAKKFYESIQ